MPYCRKCGSLQCDDFVFCTNCGTKKIDAPTNETMVMYEYADSTENYIENQVVQKEYIQQDGRCASAPQDMIVKTDVGIALKNFFSNSKNLGAICMVISVIMQFCPFYRIVLNSKKYRTVSAFEFAAEENFMLIAIGVVVLCAVGLLLVLGTGNVVIAEVALALSILANAALIGKIVIGIDLYFNEFEGVFRMIEPAGYVFFAISFAAVSLFESHRRPDCEEEDEEEN